MAKIVEYIAAGHTDVVLYKTLALMILLGLVGSVVFHEISALTAHHLAFRLIEDTRKELARTFSRLSMGEIEKKQRRMDIAHGADAGQDGSHHCPQLETIRNADQIVVLDKGCH